MYAIAYHNPALGWVPVLQCSSLDEAFNLIPELAHKYEGTALQIKPLQQCVEI